MSANPVKKKGRAWGRFAAYIIMLITAFILGGFLIYAYRVDHPKYPAAVPKADGIVVWTGKGGGRLLAGADLLEKGRGERLLISGVNEKNTRDDIIALLDIEADLAACCVDLDYAARDTIGNARETSNWSQALGYEHIILVTSAYHMPRAEMEISAARGRIHITPFPVVSEEGSRWWKDKRKSKRLFQEYGKLLLTYIRRTSAGSGRGTPVLPEMPEPIGENAQTDTSRP